MTCMEINHKWKVVSAGQQQNAYDADEMKSLILEAAAVDDDNAQSCWQVKDIKLAPGRLRGPATRQYFAGRGPCKISDLTVIQACVTLRRLCGFLEHQFKPLLDAVRMLCE